MKPICCGDDYFLFIDENYQVNVYGKNKNHQLGLPNPMIEEITILPFIIEATGIWSNTSYKITWISTVDRLYVLGKLYSDDCNYIRSYDISNIKDIGFYQRETMIIFNNYRNPIIFCYNLEYREYNNINVIEVSNNKDGSTFFLIDKYGKVKCGGYNAFGQLGFGNTSLPHVSIGSLNGLLLNDRLNNIAQISGSIMSTYFLTNNGDLYFTGSSNGLAKYIKDIISIEGIDKHISLLPCHISRFSNIKQISANFYNCLFTDIEGNLFFFGSTEESETDEPVRVDTDLPIDYIDCGVYQSLLVDTDGNIHIFGKIDSLSGCIGRIPLVNRIKNANKGNFI